MELSLIRQLWGIDKPWIEVFKRIADAGFDGVEIALPFLDPPEEYQNLLDQHQLQIVPMIFTSGDSVSAHVASFREQLAAALEFDPAVVTCHDGRDAFSKADAERYYTEVLSIEKGMGANVAHETHRGRILYNPWTTADMIDKFPDLRLCCDFSHWVCVCERIISDQEDIIRACADRAVHVHGRIGYNEGPQVPDPRIELYRPELEAHERWWDMIWDSQARQGFSKSTFTPEFGPPPYMQTNPATNEPASDLWEVSNWIASRQKHRFAQRSST